MKEQEVPPLDESFLKTYGPSIGFILLMVILCWNACRKADYTEKNGVVTVAKVIQSEKDSDVLIHIYFKGKTISEVVNTDCYFCIGGYYFVKIRKDDPKNYPIFYEDKPVPDCIIEKVKYFEGWKDFPTCDSLK